MTIISRKFDNTVYRKKVDENGKLIFTKEVTIPMNEFYEVEQKYQKMIKNRKKS